MPRLPDLNDLGARPVPISRRGIATVRNADAIGEAVSGLGKTISKTGDDLLEKQDKFETGLAKSAILTADAKAREVLADDPDYGTYDKRYREQMKAATAAAGKLIRSSSARQQFAVDAANDVERGAAALSALAVTKRRDAEQGALAEGLDGLRLAARNAPDEAASTAVIANANSLIASAKDKGTITALRAVEMRQGFVSDHVEDQFMMRYNQGDVDGAKAYLDQHRSFLDWQRANQLDSMLKGALEFRQRESDADWAIGFETRGEGTDTVRYGDPLRGKSGGVSPGGQFGAGRDYGAHNGVDFRAPVGTPVYSAGPGHVVRTGHDDQAGNFVIVDHGGGRTSSYSHLGSFDVTAGDTVSPDTVLGKVGMTGHTTGAHLHFVVKENGAAVDPTKVIGRAQQSPRQHDLTAAYAAIDQRADLEHWSPERRERAKQGVDDRVRRDELLLRRQQQQAMTSALDRADAMGAGFTDVKQLGDLSALAVEDRIQLESMAQRNRAALAPSANGDTVVGLHAMLYYAPEEFKALDLRTIRNRVTPAEFDELMKSQAELRTKGEQAPVYVQHERIWSTISRYAPLVGIDVRARKIYHGGLFGSEDESDNPKGRQAANRIFGMMKRDLEALTQGKRSPTDDEVKQAWDRGHGGESRRRRLALGFYRGEAALPSSRWKNLQRCRSERGAGSDRAVVPRPLRQGPQREPSRADLYRQQGQAGVLAVGSGVRHFRNTLHETVLFRLTAVEIYGTNHYIPSIILAGTTR